MEKRKTITKRQAVTAAKTGLAGAALSLLLLLPAAIPIYTGGLSMNTARISAAASALIGTLLAQILYSVQRKGRGVLINLFLAEGVYLMILVLLSAGIPGYSLFGTAFLPIVVTSFLGNGMGAFMQFNKSYTNGQRKKRKINRK